MPLELVTVPCLKDNYAYLLRDVTQGRTAVVDVPEVAPILKELLRHEWLLSDIFLTHHHADHIQGVEELRTITGARVWGAEADRHRLPRLDWSLWEGDEVQVGSECGTVMEVSGHTRGHIAFHFATSGYVFTGDSLMAGGCGRLFEGTPAEMWSSLRKLAALPPTDLICSGHEYTASNLRFAAMIEPENAELAARIDRVAKARAEGQPTVPSRLSEELATNPFLRAGLSVIKTAMGQADTSDVACFAALRARKDSF